MLTTQDFNQLRVIIREEVHAVVQKELIPIHNRLDSIEMRLSLLEKDVSLLKKDVRKVKKDLRVTISFFDNEVLGLGRRVTSLEKRRDLN